MIVNYHPAPRERLICRRRGSPPALRPGEGFTLLCWNIQFAASRAFNFFYEGGSAVRVPRAHVERTLDRITAVVRAHDADVNLLQEVDCDSARTAGVDQRAPLLAALRWGGWVSAPYFRSRFVPVPWRQPLGRIDNHLLSVSAFAVQWAVRHRLPGLREHAVRRAFNIKRAFVELALPLAGRPYPLIVINTHLSAFSFGDGTLARQVAALCARLDALQARGVPWILAGDLNALPPGDVAARLGADAAEYSDSDNPLEPLYARGCPGTALERYHADPERHRTYLPFGASAPDRKLDYIFVGPGVQVRGCRVLAAEDPASDHLPLLLEAVVE